MKFVLFNIVVGAALAYLLVSDRGEDVAKAPPAPRIVSAGEASGSAPPVADQARPAPAAGPARPEPEPISTDGTDGVLASGPPSPSPPTVAPPLPSAPKTLAPEVGGALMMTDAARGRSLRDLARDMEGRFLTGVQ